MIQLAGMLRWRNWLGRGNGSGALDPVSTSIPGGFIIVDLSHFQVATWWLRGLLGVTI